MLGFLVPLSSAVFVSGRNVLIRLIRNRVARATVLFTNFLFTGVLAVGVLILAPPAHIESAFYWAVPISTIALMAGRYSLITALSSATLSSTIPLIAFAPLFISFTSFLILGETITRVGMIGIVAVVAGSYLLRIQNVRAGLLEPIRVLSREKGARMMLLAALCFSVAAPFAKLAIRSSTTWIAFGTSQVLGALLMTALLLIRGKLAITFRQIGRHPLPLVLIGLANFLQAVATYLAFDIMLVAYAIGIKGSNILITALLGHVVFRERQVWRTVIVGSIMVAGVVLLALD